jgi:hypothetical protein
MIWHRDQPDEDLEKSEDWRVEAVAARDKDHAHVPMETSKMRRRKSAPEATTMRKEPNPASRLCPDGSLRPLARSTRR